MTNLNQTISYFLENGTQLIQKNESLSGEPVKIRVLSEQIFKKEAKVIYQVIGKTGKIYDTLNFHFKEIHKPYYYMEALKLAIIVYWSGSFISERNVRRMEFMERYGKQHNDYLNSSLAKIYWFKKIFLFWKWPKPYIDTQN